MLRPGGLPFYGCALVGSLSLAGYITLKGLVESSTLRDHARVGTSIGGTIRPTRSAKTYIQYYMDEQSIIYEGY